MIQWPVIMDTIAIRKHIATATACNRIHVPRGTAASERICGAGGEEERGTSSL